MRKNTFFRVLTFLVCLLMIGGVLPFGVFAAEEVDGESTDIVTESTVVPELNEDAFPEDVYLIEKSEYTVSPGVYETHFITNNAEGNRQNKCYALTIDMKQNSILASYKNQDGATAGMQTVRDQAYAAEEKRGVNVVAGVNADIYNMKNGTPMGYLVMDGVKYYNNVGNQPYFAILKDGTPVIREMNVPLDDVKEAVGLWCIFVRDGINCTQKLGTYDQTGQPRTAIGIKPDGSVVMIVNDGRLNPYSNGLTWSETADMLISLGCVIAGNLDGGGSTTLVSQHEGSADIELRNMPCNGSERNVSTALLVTSNYSSNNIFSYASISCGKSEIKAGETTKFTVVGCDASGASAQLPGGTIKLLDDSFGILSQSGEFVSNGKTGTVEIVYCNGDKIYGKTSLTINEKSENDSGMQIDPETGKKSYILRGKQLKNAWMPIGDDIYYFGDDGYAVTGKYTVTEKITPVREGITDFLFKGNPASLIYTFDEEGKMIKGAVVKKGNDTYYIVGGYLEFGWHFYDDNWHFFDGVRNDTSYGKMLKGNWTRDNCRYVCDSDGNLISGFIFEDEGGRKFLWAGKIMHGWQNVNGVTWSNKKVTGIYYCNGENSGYMSDEASEAFAVIDSMTSVLPKFFSVIRTFMAVLRSI